ncbi:MAG: bacillithiol biosynthesis deacetylase BshB1 [Candidatus Eisenbacteria bacterium]|nr:bacillithiol biosynthesis deacetylase BshB1 [Candidatus Eisenbacteria bacterium]
MGEPLHVLAITAHPDDAELLMGGTLAREAAEGRRAGVLDLAAGESGTRGDARARAREAEEAAAILGLAARENLGLPDARIERSIENRLRIAERIRALRPEVLLIHHAGGRNPDHHAASLLAREAAYTAGLARILPGTAPHRPRKILEAVSFLDAPIRLVVDITPVFETKLRALRAFASQFEGAFEAGDILSNGADDLFEQVTFRNRAYGSLVQVPFGEPYFMHEPFLATDLLALRGRSL